MDGYVCTPPVEKNHMYGIMRHTEPSLVVTNTGNFLDGCGTVCAVESRMTLTFDVTGNLGVVDASSVFPLSLFEH